MNPPINLNEKEIENYARLGASMRCVSRFLGVSEATIRQKYRRAYARGAASVELSLRGKLIQQAMGGNTTALIFALKNYAGMADKPEDQDPHVGTGKSKARQLRDIMAAQGIVIEKK